MATRTIDFAPARLALSRNLNQAFANGLKTLLETKHLYQSENIDAEGFLNELVGRLPLDNDKIMLRRFLLETFTPRLSVSESESLHSLHKHPMPALLLQNVKLYCSTCKQRETFSPTVNHDASTEVLQRQATFPRTALHPRSFQLFLLTYQCETCRKMPISFLVKRNLWKLTLEGRSPIEEVEVPNFIPKAERKLFSDAIVASQTGNVLAGLFYLRSFIEQFARRQTSIKGRQTGDEILAAYQALLPADKRDHMPSLKSLYEKLSVPIHAAKEDDALFNEALGLVIEHFDFRRLHKITDAEVVSA